MRRALLLIATLACPLIAAGCQTSDNTLPNVTATPVPMPETFTGTVAKGGLDFKNFTVMVSGNISVTLTTISPNPAVAVELGVGTPSTTTCALLSGGVAPAALAGTTAQLSGALTAGNYCVQVRDSQNLGPLAYSVTVVHP